MTKKEFDQFIEDYPESLGVGSMKIGAVITTYHDHTYGRYPDNLIAFKVEEQNKENEYRIYPFEKEE